VSTLTLAEQYISPVGQNISKTIADMIALAKEKQNAVYSEFSHVLLWANPRTRPEDILAYYDQVSPLVWKMLPDAD